MRERQDESAARDGGEEPERFDDDEPVRADETEETGKAMTGEDDEGAETK